MDNPFLLAQSRHRWVAQPALPTLAPRPLTPALLRAAASPAALQRARRGPAALPQALATAPGRWGKVG